MWQMASRAPVYALLALAACGAPAPGEIVSGTRLRAEYDVGASGDRVFAGIRDRDLGTDCAWEPVDGTQRCSQELLQSLYRNDNPPDLTTLPTSGCGF